MHVHVEIGGTCLCKDKLSEVDEDEEEEEGTGL